MEKYLEFMRSTNPDDNKLGLILISKEENWIKYIYDNVVKLNESGTTNAVTGEINIWIKYFHKGHKLLHDTEEYSYKNMALDHQWVDILENYKK